mmetsp:Transcript_2925/g.7870  ORF Transcript_2925/g.7870 Transcript_2925/m.7870 type:complete len:97 (-) Transcript_2925:143-433(-)
MPQLACRGRGSACLGNLELLLLGWRVSARVEQARSVQHRSMYGVHALQPAPCMASCMTSGTDACSTREAHTLDNMCPSRGFRQPFARPPPPSVCPQ